MRIRWRNFELPSTVDVDRETISSTYGRFTIEPFEKGFGHTIGNGLRRVLLSSIEGTSVTWTRVDGVQHEFTTIAGVREDVTDVVLNLPQEVCRMPVKRRDTSRELTEPLAPDQDEREDRLGLDPQRSFRRQRDRQARVESAIQLEFDDETRVPVRLIGEAARADALVGQHEPVR